MRRWLLILMLISVPFQMAWAVAAPYCAHEGNRVAQHFGHHEHSHKSADASPADDGSAASGSLHSDCGSCHLVNAGWIVDPLMSVTLAKMTVRDYLGSRYLSRIPPGPERPQRDSVPYAVRSGNGAALSFLQV